MYKIRLLFGEQLKEWREAAGLSQGGIADALGIKQQTVSAWESGRARPHVTKAAKLDAVLGLRDGTVVAALQGLEPPSDQVIDVPTIALQTAQGFPPDMTDAERRELEALAEQMWERRSEGFRK